MELKVFTEHERTDHENARQLSGYARRTALREKYLEPPAEDFLCPCVVIFRRAKASPR